MSCRQYVKINRTAIKVTHFPILFSIYLYERTILRSTVFEPTDIVEIRGRSPGHENREPGVHLFSPKPPRLVREPSVATYHKDRALEEVFRRPYKDTVRDTTKSRERRKTSNVVNNWMQGMGPNGIASPPPEQDSAIVERLEGRRPINALRSQMSQRRRDFTERSVASDPEDFISNNNFLMPPRLGVRPINPTPSNLGDITQQTDADGDDELVTNDNDDDKMTLDQRSNMAPKSGINQAQRKPDYFGHTPVPLPRPITAKPRPITPPEVPVESSSVQRTRFLSPIKSSPPRPKSRRQSPSRQIAAEKRRQQHQRTISTNTILYNPVSPKASGGESSSSPRKQSPITARNSGKNTANGGSGGATPSGRRTPKKQIPGVTRARPIMPPKSAFMSAPNLAGLLRQNNPTNRPRAPSLGMDLGSDIGDNKAIGGGFVGAIPASFATQMAYATGGMRQRARASEGGDPDLMGRLMLARMNNLEEGFREVLSEVRDAVRGSRGGSRNEASRSRSRDVDSSPGPRPRPRGGDKKKKVRELTKKEKGKDKAVTAPPSNADDVAWVDEDAYDEMGGWESPKLKGSSV